MPGSLDGLPTVKREHGPQPEEALDRIVGVERFDRWLERYKADGLYNHRPRNTPWSEVPEARKVSALIGRARHDGPPGTHVLAVIEREVDYGKLPAWRRTALEGFAAPGPDAGELEGDHPRDLQDQANYALRLAEYEARVEDYKHFGGVDDWGVYHRWPEFKASCAAGQDQQVSPVSWAFTSSRG